MMGPFFSDTKPATPGATVHRDLTHVARNRGRPRRSRRSSRVRLMFL